MEDLLKNLERYNFECEAGPLKNCVEWKILRSEITALTNALWKACADDPQIVRDTLESQRTE